jgi:hypothetical protein
MTVGVNPPKTPVTKGSNGIAAATVPNVCKMPGPPAPFVPAPLPNIGRSSLSPKGYTKKVLVEGKPTAIKGASFASQGDVASKGTGGGLVSSNTHGPTKFLGLGSLDVKFEGKNVQLLSDPMLNNCGPSGNPANAATLAGVLQQFAAAVDSRIQVFVDECDAEVNKKWDEDNPDKPHTDCWAKTGKVERGEPVTVQQQLGRDKEQCVYDKMGAQDGVPQEGKGQFAGMSVTTQKRFNPNGTPFSSGNWTGTIVPDIVMSDASGTVGAVRDLKFPCPSEQNKPGRWSPGQREKYEAAFGVSPSIICPG